MLPPEMHLPPKP